MTIPSDEPKRYTVAVDIATMKTFLRGRAGGLPDDIGIIGVDLALSGNTVYFLIQSQAYPKPPWSSGSLIQVTDEPSPPSAPAKTEKP